VGFGGICKGISPLAIDSRHPHALGICGAIGEVVDGFGKQFFHVANLVRAAIEIAALVDQDNELQEVYTKMIQD
jgi:hypothetical protein